MRTIIACLLTLAVSVDYAAAQRPGRGGEEGFDRQPPRENAGRFGEGRPQRGPEGGPRRGPMGGRGFDGPPTPDAILNRMSEALADRLDLDASQQVQFDEIVAVFREDMQLQAEGQPSPREIFEQMREAREAGDEAAADALRDQMRGHFSAMGDTMAVMLDEVEPILNAEQVNRLGEFRQRMEQRRRDMNPRESMEKVVERMRTDLDMTPEQLDAFEGMVTDLEAEGEAMRNRWREMGPLMREAREARENGDDSRMEEIRAQMEEMRGAPGEMIDRFFEEVGGMLDPDQREQLQAMRADAPFANRDGRGPGGRDRGQLRQLKVQDVLRAAKRLDVNQEQRDKINQVESEAGYNLRQAGRDAASENVVARQAKAEIESVLDDEQKAQFNRALGTENEGRRDRRDRRDRTDRRRGEDRGVDDADRGRRRKGGPEDDE